MKDLFQTMQVFNPVSVHTIVDIEVTATTDHIEADLITINDDDDDATVFPHQIKHPDFELWLAGQGHLTPEIVLDKSDTVTGEHVQDVWIETIDYSEYMRFHLDKDHIYEYLVSTGKTTLNYQPE